MAFLFLGVPGEEARVAILTTILGNLGISSSHVGVDDKVVRSVASRAHGFVAADLLLVCKEAAMTALARARIEGQSGKSGTVV